MRKERLANWNDDKGIRNVGWRPKCSRSTLCYTSLVSETQSKTNERQGKACAGLSFRGLWSVAEQMVKKAAREEGVANSTCQDYENAMKDNETCNELQ